MFLFLVFSEVASCIQVFICLHLGFFPKVAVLWQREDIQKRMSMQIHVRHSVLESRRVKNQSFGCKISTSNEQPRQSVVESQRIKSYWTRKAASKSSCMFLERDPCLRRATRSLQPESGKLDRRLQQTVYSLRALCKIAWIHSRSNYSPVPQSNVQHAVPLGTFILSYVTEGFDCTQCSYFRLMHYNTV